MPLRVGFIGLGNVGGKLAGSLLRNGFSLTVLDRDPDAVRPLLERGAAQAETPRELAEASDIIITCLPSPQDSAAVMETPGSGLLAGLSSGKLWMEMSTTDEAEVRRLAAAVEGVGARAMDCPVSGGCHRAATGNIAIFAGGSRDAFEAAMPVLSAMGRHILHTGGLGSASVLKVVTNYLASVHLAALGEALTTAKMTGMDMNTAYEAIRISSGNSFVHETESQVILNGSYNINFTMDLVLKDMGLFEAVAERGGVPLEISPVVMGIFRDAARRYGDREWSSKVVARLEEACGTSLRGAGFPGEITDAEPEAPGVEVVPGRG